MNEVMIEAIEELTAVYGDDVQLTGKERKLIGNALLTIGALTVPVTSIAIDVEVQVTAAAGKVPASQINRYHAVRGITAIADFATLADSSKVYTLGDDGKLTPGSAMSAIVQMHTSIVAELQAQVAELQLQVKPAKAAAGATSPGLTAPRFTAIRKADAAILGIDKDTYMAHVSNGTLETFRAEILAKREVEKTAGTNAVELGETPAAAVTTANEPVTTLEVTTVSA